MRKDKGIKILSADSVKLINDKKNIVFSFMHFCRNQGASFEDWQNEGKLLRAIERFKEYSNKKISQTDGTYAIYGNFPTKTVFTHPSYIPQDARWARIHVDGTHIIAGHIVDNVFYVVFLDSNHSFWRTEKRHT